VIQLLATVAHAADGVDGVLLPGASPLEATASIGAWAGGGAALFAGSVGFVGVEASLALGPRWALFATGFVSTPEIELGPTQLTSLRWLAVDRPGVHLAPMLSVVSIYERPLQGSVGPGLAMEGGGERWRFDLSVPTIAGVGAHFDDYGEYGLGPAILAEASELGVTRHGDGAGRFRIGIVPPSLGWGLRTDRLYVDVSGMFALIAFGGTVKVGGRFGDVAEPITARVTTVDPGGPAP
jgi:hypothetical protein